MSTDNTALAKVAEKLQGIRTRTDLKLRPTPLLKQTFTDFSGEERNLVIRYYQVQGILHLIFMKRFMLGDDTGLGKCKTLSSWVLTRKGLVSLGDLAPKKVSLQPDTFYPLDEPVEVWTGWGWAPVKSYYHGGVKPIKTVRTRRGYTTTGSFVHPIWARHSDGESFVKMAEIEVGDSLCISREVIPFPEKEPDLPLPSPHDFLNSVYYEVPEQMSPDLAMFLAYLVAWGRTNSPHYISILQNRDADPEMHDRIRALGETLFDWVGSDSNKNRFSRIEVFSEYIRAYLFGIGVGYWTRGRSCIPWSVHQGTRESVRAFLQAFFDRCGNIVRSVIEVIHPSKRLIQELQVLLLRFGVVCSCGPVKSDGLRWRISIREDDVPRFQAQIGFISQRKQKALKALLKKLYYANLDTVPHIHSQVGSLTTDIQNTLPLETIAEHLGENFKLTLSEIRRRKRNPTYKFLHQLLSVARVANASDTGAYQVIDEICQKHFYYDPVVEITTSDEVVADIEVDDDCHSFVADGFVNHNTIQSIAALCYLWEKDPERKVLVLTTKSATPQWAKEFGKFTRGVRVIVASGTRAQREAAYAAWRKSSKPTVMIMGYRAAVNDIRKLQEDTGYILITDEATAYKNPKTQVHQVVRHMSSAADRTWALSATLIKNNLMEGHGIFQVVVPGLFRSADAFMRYFCIMEMMQIGRGRKVARVVGYYPEKVAEFREAISLYYYGRPKHEVAAELPSLTRDVFEVSLSAIQESKYREALTGLLTVGETRPEGEEEKEVTKLTAISYCQQIVNHPDLIECEGTSDKMDALIDILTNGDLDGEKVIVFSRFKKMVNILMPALHKAGLNPVRVTGDETGDQRQTAQDKFQNPTSDTRVICITMAGGDAINLQAAKAIIFYDTPWSAGDYIQIVGRMIRIGSQHDKVLAIHLVAKLKNGKPTIDHRVMEVIDSKMQLIEAVLGERLRGASSGKNRIEVTSEVKSIFDGLQEDAKAV